MRWRCPACRRRRSSGVPARPSGGKLARRGVTVHDRPPPLADRAGEPGRAAAPRRPGGGTGGAGARPTAAVGAALRRPAADGGAAGTVELRRRVLDATGRRGKPWPRTIAGIARRDAAPGRGGGPPRRRHGGPIRAELAGHAGGGGGAAGRPRSLPPSAAGDPGRRRAGRCRASRTGHRRRWAIAPPCWPRRWG